jgi:integrase/recombinase XerD
MDSIFVWPSARKRHQEAPLLHEREQYLSHLLGQGISHDRVRSIASTLLQVVRLLELSSLRSVNWNEVEGAARCWARDRDFHRTRKPGKSTARSFAAVAGKWLRFHGQTIVAPSLADPSDLLIDQFVDALLVIRGLSPETVRGYSWRARQFLIWLADQPASLSSVSLHDVDDYLDFRRAHGWCPRTIAATCQALRAFFGYAESRGWCVPNLPYGIRSPTIPKYENTPRGPSWREVRRLLQSTSGGEPANIRARAIFLLCSIYALRSSEVTRLCIGDFDWRNETLTVKRSKRGRVQQYPLQYEVGEAILRYLREVRPHCSCRNVFVTRRPPHRPLSASSLGAIVRKHMKALGIETKSFGPHGLRHACATELLKKGISLQEIADFLGHRDTKSVSIYARYDVRSLQKVAAFSLGWAR